MRDGNGYIKYNFIWTDLIGTYNHFLFKNTTTTWRDSINKSKWGKRKDRYYSGESRRTDKKFFKKMLKDDYGIENLNQNINYESIKNYTEG
jgi:hypothetical protein